MDASSKIYNSVAVVTMNYNGNLNGITVAWIMRSSINPKILAISIGKQRYSYELLKKVNFFGINLLSVNQINIAKHFGTISERNFNKFEGINFKMSKNKIPILNGVVAYLECEKIGDFEAGDHNIFLGKVNFEEIINNEKVLLYGEHKFWRD
ncbi:flavin reductase (DIM6/NTAB) family NADH-FMN oxidoreductase RutF [Thermosipho japonicus]|uniref:Flavin reductase (DIM6/NTAB) family NADH-FMN oxidoreductase RutF n=1 Tax=Thermosipho japonicus TaxID=90323 RepID=A0A841GHC8_9BACT|nr:flavin reductase family protein [Thermosipho japonicus]MBB6063106.1 flavin reductase (DIM6/NTAB) family NADH-FMN oxidoreductase RutF [Thermosipho japonicus]